MKLYIYIYLYLDHDIDTYIYIDAPQTLRVSTRWPLDAKPAHAALSLNPYLSLSLSTSIYISILAHRRLAESSPGSPLTPSLLTRPYVYLYLYLYPYLPIYLSFSINVPQTRRVSTRRPLDPEPAHEAIYLSLSLAISIYLSIYIYMNVPQTR